MNKREVRPHVYLLEFQTQAELASTFLRFQEHYESPEFKGKIFTRAEFEKWYAGENGSFSYCSDWSGFNIPSIILEPFRAGSFNPLSLEEQNFLKHFEGLEHPFYIIGTYSAASPEK
ncbi:MAG: hypothetical protein JWL80_621, partial [Parcubacteria group bacterium]|nr:hypothetical protein [Parcubacteria group bacterium]